MGDKSEMNRPFARSYWVEPGGILAGCYPGDPDRNEHLRKLGRLAEVGVTCIVNLMEADEVGHGGQAFAPYEGDFERLSAEAGRHGQCLRLAIRDRTAPAASTMVEILDTIDRARKAGHAVYVHCWGGRGRTGTVVGCWLVRHGHAAGASALERVQELRVEDPTAHLPSPETNAQRELVNNWALGQ